MYEAEERALDIEMRQFIADEESTAIDKIDFQLLWQIERHLRA